MTRVQTRKRTEPCDLVATLALAYASAQQLFARNYLLLVKSRNVEDCLKLLQIENEDLKSIKVSGKSRFGNGWNTVSRFSEPTTLEIARCIFATKMTNDTANRRDFPKNIFSWSRQFHLAKWEWS